MASIQIRFDVGIIMTLPHPEMKFASDRVLERFWTKVGYPDKTDCWLWLGSTSNGYGQFWDGKRKQQAHRFSYEFMKGAIPKGLTLDHSCRVRACVYPEHLQAMSLVDNCRLGSPAQNTHCPKGHPFEETNLIWHGDAKDRQFRVCRLCKQESDRKYYWKHRCLHCERIKSQKKYHKHREQRCARYRELYRLKKESRAR